MSVFDNYYEVLLYSDKQLAVIKEHGDEAGVILVDGASKPVLWTEMRCNIEMLPFEEARRMGSFMRVIPNDEVKSNWDDAVTFYRGDGKGYKRLVNGLGDVTHDGKDFCSANNIEATADALRAFAIKPQPQGYALKLNVRLAVPKLKR